MQINNFNFEILTTKALYAEATMRFDEQLLAGLQDQPIIHFYDWELDSATYGYFVKPEEYLNMQGVQRSHLHLSKRPTGGGIIFHNWDMPFSVLIPSLSPLFSINTLENYAFVNQAVLRAVTHFLGASLHLTPLDLPASDSSSTRFCMARPTKYDLMLGGRKVAGAAQRQTKKGFLHQGTIALSIPDYHYLEKVLLPGTAVAFSMQQYTQPLLKGNPTQKEMVDAKKELRYLLCQFLQEGK